MQLWYSSLYFHVHHERKSIKANEITQWVKSLATKPDYLSSISRTHRLSCDLFHTSLHTYAHTHTQQTKVLNYTLWGYDESWVIQLGALVLGAGQRDWVHTHGWETAMERQSSPAMRCHEEKCKDHSRGSRPCFGQPFVSHGFWLWAAQLTGRMKGSGLHLTARTLG